MKLYGIIVTIQFIQSCSALEMLLPNDDDPVTVAAVNIVERCFGLDDRWSELLIVPKHTSYEIFKMIHQYSKTSNLIVSLNCTEKNVSKHLGEWNNDFNTRNEGNEFKPNAVIMTIRNVEQLECLLDFLKNDNQKIWQPGSYFFIVLENRCNLAECNDMFKVIWNYWILNSVILCSSDNPADRNRKEIDLYTFNPYSGDHPQKWKKVIEETLPVSINSENFNHSWYIFEQRFTKINSSKDCSNLFYDKTSNLDGYLIPISSGYSKFSFNSNTSDVSKLFAIDIRVLNTLTKLLRFNVTQVLNKDPNEYGRLLENGTYIGPLDDIFTKRSHLAPTIRTMKFYPDLEMMYPHDRSSACIVSRIVGDRPQWTNLVVAKDIWINVGFVILFFTVILYLQNKSNGIVSAFLEAERFFVGSSIIHVSRVIKHRIILGSIFLVFLVIDGTIKGRFTSLLTVIRPYPNIETIEQVLELNVEVYGHTNYRETMLNPKLKARLNSSLNSSECLESLKQEEHHQRVCFGDCRFIKLLTFNSSDIHTAKTPILTYYLTYVTAKHWPLGNRYNTEVQTLVETGIFKKWQLNTYWELEVNSWKLKRTREQPRVRSTKLNDLLPAFAVLIVGLSMALMVFAWEMKGNKNSIHDESSK